MHINIHIYIIVKYVYIYIEMWFCFILSILEALKACHLGFPGTPGDPNRFPSGEIFPKLQRVASRDPLGICLRDRDKQLTYVQLLESSRVVFTSDFGTFRTSRSFTSSSLKSSPGNNQSASTMAGG